LTAEPARVTGGVASRGRRGPYQKGKLRRREILLAAIEVFSRNGYRDASIREIAETVGLTQAGLLHYFPSKQDLFVEVLRVRDELHEARADDIIEAFRLSSQNNAEVEGLVHLFVTVSAEAIDDTHPGHAYFQSRYDRLTGLLRARITAGQNDGTVTKAITADMAARLFIAVMDGIQVQWLLDPDHTDMVAALDALWHVLLAP
jgi:AcrR family transcriptional regulator